MHWTLYLAIPIGIAFGFSLVPHEILSLEIRLILHSFSFLLCYIPYLLGSYWQKRNSLWASRAYYSATIFRVIGLVLIWFVFKDYSPDDALSAITLYALSIGTFIFFQLASIVILQKIASRKS